MNIEMIAENLMNVVKDEKIKTIYVRLYNIEKICNVNVLIDLMPKKITECQYTLLLKVLSYENSMSEDEDVEDVVFNQSLFIGETMIECVTKCINKLNNIERFDKFNGKFIFKDEESKIKVCICLSKDLITNKHIQQKDLSCCICLDDTLTETYCNHRLCLECWSNIKETSTEDYAGMKTKKCPLCRETLFVKR